MGINSLSKIVPDAIRDYPIIETEWLVKRWLPVDTTRLIDWYNDLVSEYQSWIWTYGKHKEMWKYDVNEKLGEHLKPDTGWLMLTWGDNTEGPVPWLRTIAKDEYAVPMPKYDLSPRKCFTGYALDFIKSFPVQATDIQVAIHSPGTKLPQHQDEPDCFRFHIPIITHPDARFIINGHDIHLPADGWVYLVNTSYPHETINNSEIDRVHIYGNVPTVDILSQNLNQMETIV
jgi:hypothetical protein